MEKIITSISLTKDLKAFLDQFAKEKGLARSTIIVLLLTKLKEGKVEII